MRNLPEKTSELEEVSGQEPEKQSKVLFKASSHDNIPESSYSPFNSEHTASGPLLLTSTGFQNSTTKCGEAKFPVDVSRGLGRHQSAKSEVSAARKPYAKDVRIAVCPIRHTIKAVSNVAQLTAERNWKMQVAMSVSESKTSEGRDKLTTHPSGRQLLLPSPLYSHVQRNKREQSTQGKMKRSE